MFTKNAAARAVLQSASGGLQLSAHTCMHGQGLRERACRQSQMKSMAHVRRSDINFPALTRGVVEGVGLNTPPH
jgi:hypothetical protein